MRKRVKFIALGLIALMLAGGLALASCDATQPKCNQGCNLTTDHCGSDTFEALNGNQRCWKSSVSCGGCGLGC